MKNGFVGKSDLYCTSEKCGDNTVHEIFSEPKFIVTMCVPCGQVKTYQKEIQEVTAHG